MVIGLVVGAGLAAALYTAVRDTRDTRQVVDEYFTALADRRFDDAYQALCPEARASHPRDEFEEALDARLPTAHTTTDELRINRMPWRSTATVGVQVTYADSTSEDREISLTRPDGSWLICGSPY